MVDLSHLERMGRELKCPICLSLLKSAVSLTCNHVFCNLCIAESMKSVSDCPVCKVPFHRREVRPAPHMDNLVTVFKNMEVAAGVNIFTTQVGPSTENPGDAENNSSTKETALTRLGRSKKKVSANKMRQKSEKANVKTSDSCQQEKPSFPAKKRIHVTPYPVSETPVPPKKVSKLANTSNELETSRSLDEDKRVAADGQEDILFTPFFWLREENGDDEASGKPSSQPTADTSETHFARFSDIKDSEDDKSPIKTIVTSQFDAAEAFDSEMFEWTQRACSPELCSTPLKKETAGRNKLDTIQEKYCPEQTRPALNNEIPHDKSTKNTKTVQANMNNDKRNNTLLAMKGRFTEKKRPERTKGKHLKKCTISHGSSLDEVHPEIILDTAEREKYSSQDDEDAGQKELPSCGRSIRKRSKKPTKNYQMENSTDVAEASMQVPTISTRQEIRNEDAEFKGILLPVLKSNTIKNEAELNVQNKTRTRGKQTALQPKKKHMKLSMDNAMTKTLDEVPNNAVTEAKTQNHEYETSIRGNLSEPSENKEVAENGSHRSVPGIQKVVRESRGKRKRKTQTVESVVYNNHEVHVASPENDGGKNNQADSLADKNVPSTKQVSCNNGDKVLRKCGNIHSQIICAFCQSSNSTKDSGEMMHYFNDKPVAADYNGGVNVIHSHKNCTEWAPDIYFEDDLAINLAVELARSRRIKCSCCGIKGAALGCYEKCCRRSFHFTCAKLIPECRWDNDNFVMLCPLHSSSKLPKESFEPVKQRRKKTNPKGEPKTPKHCKNGHDMSQKWKWPSGSPCKWVLCCSALTAIEKDIISEFTRLTGVPVSKTWSAAVTHVIASTDDNGMCRRTLKFLMGILDGKWILSIEWIKACLMAMEPVDEEKFEITVDVHGISGGPRLGRLRAINKNPKFFGNFRFYLAGGFTPSYKGYLQDLVTAAGGTVMHRKPLTRDQEQLFHNTSALETFIVYSIEVPDKQKSGKGIDFSSRRAEAQALADDCGAKVATSSWIIDSIAAFKLQRLT